jgi:hypothetical protein
MTLFTLVRGSVTFPCRLIWSHTDLSAVTTHSCPRLTAEVFQSFPVRSPGPASLGWSDTPLPDPHTWCSWGEFVLHRQSQVGKRNGARKRFGT